jgi:phosphoserine aminotransferase
MDKVYRAIERVLSEWPEAIVRVQGQHAKASAYAHEVIAVDVTSADLTTERLAREKAEATVAENEARLEMLRIHCAENEDCDGLAILDNLSTPADVVRVVVDGSSHVSRLPAGLHHDGVQWFTITPAAREGMEMEHGDVLHLVRRRG